AYRSLRCVVLVGRRTTSGAHRLDSRVIAASSVWLRAQGGAGRTPSLRLPRFAVEARKARAKSPLNAGFSSAPKRTRTSTGHTAHKALNLGHRVFGLFYPSRFCAAQPNPATYGTRRTPVDHLECLMACLTGLSTNRAGVLLGSASVRGGSNRFACGRAPAP